MKTTTTFAALLGGTLLMGSALQAQIISENFTAPDKIANNGANGYLGTGGAGFNYNGNFGTWLYSNGNSGIDEPGAGLENGTNNDNRVSSIGLARPQDWRGANARAVSVIYDGSLFTNGQAYTVSFDLIGDASGANTGRYWLAEVSGYDSSGNNYIQIDGTHDGWASAKPFTAAGTADVNFLADSISNGVLLTNSNTAGTFPISFDFTYTAGTDLAFAVGTFNNVFAIDNFTVTAVPEPSTAALIGLAVVGIMIARRRRS